MPLGMATIPMDGSSLSCCLSNSSLITEYSSHFSDFTSCLPPALLTNMQLPRLTPQEPAGPQRCDSNRGNAGKASCV